MYLHMKLRCGKISTGDIAMMCDKCSGKCYICGLDAGTSQKKVYICSTCFHSAYRDKCIVCKLKDPKNNAYCCRECWLLQKNHDRCPVLIQ
ncbi:hypothetical protein EHEL_080970 [Encephalitozoon hellem ATCC 50504]|uniref:PHF5-like protein n=1 Tax=Encephalitozoon hellem TaxID=27973 RepID=A0A9Q9CD70_ENCHE|nr:uncharacterized protein EHEL_080970 [Encephalitozoon hellem ATCC 50504]AFM98797.1 hypothetical protein EHEL_080970 [Encephalitozoon hellem ATCC 50504]UTX43774.1 PHF5-like protein [Encephalitozoon hellem]WEL39253.1 PHF5-like protein [Encephalitozoon hellem]|eukprot:XP_003887778.1 hypothetical protein EHEL_080970 [Encephalitozoon hellem ATCC 50504]